MLEIYPVLLKADSHQKQAARKMASQKPTSQILFRAWRHGHERKTQVNTTVKRMGSGQENKFCRLRSNFPRHVFQAFTVKKKMKVKSSLLTQEII